MEDINEKEMEFSRRIARDKDIIEEIARTIAWAYWKAFNVRDRSKDEYELWECLGEHHREAYRKAALAVAAM